MLVTMRPIVWIAAVVRLATGETYEHCACASCTPGGTPGEVRNIAVETEVPTPPTFPPKGDSHVRDETIIRVMVSSFRDPRCGQTLYNIFDRAVHPNRMAVGVVEQTLRNGMDAFDCVATYCALVAEKRPGLVCPHLGRISTVRVDAATAKGPIWARAMGASMVQPTDGFCMQVDAHVDFNVGYDVSMLKMWAMLANEYGVLSTYVGNIVQDLSAKGEVLIGAPRYDVPVICRTLVGGHGVVRNEGADGGRCLEKPILSLAWAAGWSFAKCHFERNVPNDPHLEGLFDGEEFSRMLRAFTWGYDVYTPHRPIVFHDYRHSLPWQRKREGTWGRGHDPAPAVRRYKSLMEFPGTTPLVAGDVYGVGTRRTIDQFKLFSGIDARTSRQQDDKRCHKLKWVPFTEDPAIAARVASPIYPGGLPGNLTVDSTRTALMIVEPKYIAAARGMRSQMKTDAPPIATLTQRAEFGEPAAAHWADSLAAYAAEKEAAKIASAQEVAQRAAVVHASSRLAMLDSAASPQRLRKKAPSLDTLRRAVAAQWADSLAADAAEKEAAKIALAQEVAQREGRYRYFVGIVLPLLFVAILVAIALRRARQSKRARSV